MRPIVVLICGVCISAVAPAQKIYEEQKGSFVEWRSYFDSTGVNPVIELYSRNDFFKSGEEKIGLFAYVRANRRSAPPSAAVAGLSYSPNRFIGTELGGGLNANPGDKFYWVRGRLWLGQEMGTIHQGDFYYFDCIGEVGGRGFQNWEVRLKFRPAPWLGCGIFGEKTKGFGPRIDIQPTLIPFTASVIVLVVRWDAAEHTLKQRDLIGALFLRLIL